jgi:serine/threonine protein kinase
MAPEIHAKKPYSGASVDLFAAAIILFIMYAGTPPFSKADKTDPYYRLLCNNKHETFWTAHTKHKPSKEYFSPAFRNFLNSLLAEDPAHRPSIAEIKKHEWYLGETYTHEQLQKEFQVRKQTVDKELEKARL